MCHENDLPTAAGVEAEAEAAGLTIAQLCRNAGIAHSTFTRWRARKTEPTLPVLRRLYRAITAARITRNEAHSKVAA